MFFFFFNDTATTEIYTLSLHDALPISLGNAPDERHLAALEARTHLATLARGLALAAAAGGLADTGARAAAARDRKSTRLNSSHANISYAVFCLKKKKTK